jgi:hypothetical protein
MGRRANGRGGHITGPGVLMGPSTAFELHRPERYASRARVRCLGYWFLRDGRTREALAAYEVSQRLAEEFGFTVSVQIEGTSLWVRFARCSCQSDAREWRGLCG